MKKLLNDQRGVMILPIIVAGVLTLGGASAFAFSRVQQNQLSKNQKASEQSLQQKITEAEQLKKEAKLKAETAKTEDKPVEIPALEKTVAVATKPAPATTTKTESKPAAPKPAPAQPTGSLSLQHVSGTNVAWALNGSAPYGLKLVWANGSGPVYPGSSAKYFNGASTTSANIDAGAGSYYVRVCMYYEGKCMNYSNEIYITVP